MKLKKVSILNYKHIEKIDLNLSNDITMLAGPNNSGKTTLIELVKNLLDGKKFTYKYDDIPVTDRKK